jgi:hypothetical protein
VKSDLDFIVCAVTALLVAAAFAFLLPLSIHAFWIRFTTRTHSLNRRELDREKTQRLKLVRAKSAINPIRRAGRALRASCEYRPAVGEHYSRCGGDERGREPR